MPPSTGPVGCIARWRAERQIDHPLHDGGGKRLLAGLARLVAGEPVDTLGHESRLPSPDHGLRFAGAAHDLSGTAALGRRQDDVGAPYMLLRRAAVRDDRLESTAIRPCRPATGRRVGGPFAGTSGRKIGPSIEAV